MATLPGRLKAPQTLSTVSLYPSPPWTASPDTIHKPDGTSTNTNAELGFPGAVDDGLPAFVNLPVLLPVPTGTALPLSKSIAQGIPAPPEGKNWWPPLLFWMECICYLFERNNGNPVTSTAPNSLFAGGKIALEDLENWNSCCVKESIHITFQVLLPENDVFLLAWPTMSAKQDQKLLGWYNKTKLTTEELVSSPGATASANNSSIPIDLTVTKEILSQLGNVTKSSKDKSNDDLIKSLTISWQLVGSRLAPKDGCPDMTVVVPGSINSAFEAVIKETNKRIRGMKMAESFISTLSSSARRSSWQPWHPNGPRNNSMSPLQMLLWSLLSSMTPLSVNPAPLVTRSPSFVSWLSSPPTSISRSGSPVSSSPTAKISMVNRIATRLRRPLNSL
jgi:hypothetical protein